jgi:repressor LexA
MLYPQDAFDKFDKRFKIEAMMHPIQEKLLELAEKKNLGTMTLREIGSYINESAPQKVKHHLGQLEKKGLIRVDRVKGMIEKTSPGLSKGFVLAAKLFTVPIVGSANCGPAQILAEANIAGYLRVSSTFVGRKKAQDLFALKASGPSMNRTNVGGKTIDDGDYVIIDRNDCSPRNGDVVLSIIDGMANIKKFYRDERNQQIVLVSESTQNFPPICIHYSDSFSVNGKVVGVVKKPKIK